MRRTKHKIKKRSKLFFDKLCSLLHSSTTFHSVYILFHWFSDVLIFSGSIKMSKIRPLPQNETFVLHSEAFQNSTKRFLWKWINYLVNGRNTGNYSWTVKKGRNSQSISKKNIFNQTHPGSKNYHLYNLKNVKTPMEKCYF